MTKWQEILHRAKIKKDDEFYTPYWLCESEFSNYDWKDKVILCPCDERKSNITKWFIDNFSKYQIKRVLSVGLNGDYIDYPSMKEWANLGAETPFKSTFTTKWKAECDIVVTNPPFSIISEYFDWVKDKKFVMFAPITFIYQKSFFPYFKSKSVICVRSGGGEFMTEKKGIKTAPMCILTNVPRKNTGKKFLYTKTEIENMGYHFEVFDEDDTIINVDNSKYIPKDYMGVMGVPPSMFGNYNYDNYEILDYVRWHIKGKTKFQRILIRRIK